MAWELEEALDYYRRQGAPGDQSMLINLLKEIQEESGGTLTRSAVAAVAQSYGVKESFLLAIMKRIPSLRLDNSHCLEICGGPVCAKRAQLMAFVKKTYGAEPKGFTLKYGNCMRLCGKGPNIKWDGVLYSGADEKLIRSLVEQK